MSYEGSVESVTLPIALRYARSPAQQPFHEGKAQLADSEVAT